MATIDSIDMVGEIFFSANPVIEKFAVRLDGPVVLSKATYPKLYFVVREAGLMVPGSDVDLTFTIDDLSGYFLQNTHLGGTTVDRLVQNMPIPTISASTASNNASHAHSLSSAGKTVDAGILGQFEFGDWGSEDYRVPIRYATDDCVATGGSSFSPTNGNNQGNTGFNYQIEIHDRQRNLTGATDTDNAAHSHTATAVVNPDTNYTSDPELRPKTLRLFMYIRADV